MRFIQKLGLIGILAGSILGADAYAQEPTLAPPKPEESTPEPQSIAIQMIPLSENDAFVVGPRAKIEDIAAGYTAVMKRHAGISDKAAKRMAISIEDITDTLDDYDAVKKRYADISDYAAAEMAAEVAEGHGFVYEQDKKKVKVIKGVEVSMEAYDRIKAKLPEIDDKAAALLASCREGRGTLHDQYFIVDDFTEVKEKYPDISEEAAAILTSTAEATGITLREFDALRENYSPQISTETIARVAAWW